ncbi:MAG: respiratory nitrate reductase subunit gamma [Acidimicrobiia bacterium]|nr:respiratory nitrate reductase subunit gamma [Acidimicrobiia bacterium]
MTANEFLFGVVPYVVLVLAIVGTIVRWRTNQFSVSSLSSQLLESRRLYWGSVSFHWGLSLILVGHIAALVIPRGFELWNGAPLRLYLLEITGLALAFWAAFGVTVLIVRRFSSPKVRRVTTPMDAVVLLIIAVQIVTGIWIAIGYRWGSYWGTSVFVPYVRSLLRLQPDPAYVDPLPWVLKAHVLTFFAFLAVFPFTRLVHIITLPLQYFTRPWQKVVAARETPPIRHYR